MSLWQRLPGYREIHILIHSHSERAIHRTIWWEDTENACNGCTMHFASLVAALDMTQVSIYALMSSIAPFIASATLHKSSLLESMKETSIYQSDVMVTFSSPLSLSLWVSFFLAFTRIALTRTHKPPMYHCCTVQIWQERLAGDRRDETCTQRTREDTRYTSKWEREWKKGKTIAGRREGREGGRGARRREVRAEEAAAQE